jgi:hypothetical protein
MAGFTTDPNHDSAGPSRYRPQSGIGHAPAYMVAGHPFMTGTTMTDNQEFKVAFPFVAKRIVVACDKQSTETPKLRVSFRTQIAGTDLNVTNKHHYFELDGDEEAMTFNVKCKEIYIRNVSGATSGFQLYAELTGIPTSSMYVLTGSGLSGDGIGPSDHTN